MFSLSSRVTLQPLEISYSDVWSHAQTSVSEHTYYVSFIDVMVNLHGYIFLSSKSRCWMYFKTNVRLSVFVVTKSSLCGPIGEPSISKLTKTNSSLGVSHLVSCPHKNQQNGTAEPEHRHILEIRLSLLAHASFLFNF